jgi:protoheme IX farnesyltransferase
MGLVYDYGVLLKPKVLFAMLALYIRASFNANDFTTGFMAVAFAVSGANALNCYIDRDIDALMTRTKGRPLSIGTIKPFEALSFSILMMGMATLLAISSGVVSVLLLIEGAGSYLILYSVLVKRRTSLNVLATAPSVAAPAWYGWYLGGAPLYPLGILMGSIVAIWGPLHLWSIAFAYSKDYTRVGVPMFPSMVSRETAIRGIIIALTLLIGSSYLLLPWSKSNSYLIGVTIINIPLASVGIKFLHEKTNKAGWWLFKLTSPYIILVFLSFMINRLM